MSELKFKAYGELEISEALSDASHVIIEENGDVKRFPANSIGKVKTVNGAEPDESGNVAVEIHAPVQPDFSQNDPEAADYMKNRPFWREVEKKAIPHIEYPISFTTTDVGNGFFMAQGSFGFMEDTVNYVVFDGVEYECEPHFDDFARGIVIGASDFVAYPFCIVNGAIITKTAGEHTIEQYYDENVVRAEYLPYLLIDTKKTEDKTPYIELEDVEKIKVAFKNGIPIRLYADVGGIGAYMQVLSVSKSFICASGPGVIARGTVEQVTYQFSVEDGTLYESAFYVLGSVDDNGNNYPVMYINNKYYKITVADDGTLTATEVTA